MEYIFKIAQEVESVIEEYQYIASSIRENINELSYLWKDSATQRLYNTYIVKYQDLEKELLELFNFILESYTSLQKKIIFENEELSKIRQKHT